jgi:acetyl esterase/lipase
VAICPEYALLPKRTFPFALSQTTDVYSALVDGDAVIDLGFEVNRIVVTGESAGGNLAAALCVKLGLQKLAVDQAMNELVEESGDASDAMSATTVGEEPTRLRDHDLLRRTQLVLGSQSFGCRWNQRHRLSEWIAFGHFRCLSSSRTIWA